MRNNFRLSLLLCAPLLVAGCGDINDPVISSPVITTTAIGPTSLNISWVKATDSNTSASSLVYKVYVSGPNPAYQSFDTLGEVEAGTLVQTLTDAASAAITTGISANSAHYINIVAEDGDGNKALYEPLGEYFNAGQVSYYPFNGNGSNAALSTNPLRAITVYTGFTLPTVTSDRFNHAGSAYGYTQASKHCWESTDLVGITGSTNRAVSFWVQSSNSPAGATRAPFAWGNDSGNGTSFGFLETGVGNNWAVWLGTLSVTTGTPTTSSWEHWVISSTGNNVFTYVNGVQKNNGTLTTVSTANSRLYVGCGVVGADLGNLFQGNIDDVRIFNLSLSSTDVTNLYRATQP